MAEIHHLEHGWVTPTFSYLLSFLGSLLGLICAVRLRSAPSTGWRAWWLGLAAVAIGGTGIWTMHFVAMMGFGVVGSPIRYDVLTTAVSAVIAVVAVGIGLAIVSLGTRARRTRILIGGVLTGLGVAAMHYTGMFAMRLDGEIDYAGNHGFELVTANGRVISEEVTQAARAIKAALVEIVALSGALPDGVLIEDKEYTASVHYRLTKDPDAAGIVLKSVLKDIVDRHGVLLTEGRLVYELRPRLDINKGVFTANDIRLHGIRTAAFLGDDITDLDGFRALAELTESGELLASASIGVRAPENPARLIAESDLLVDGVAGMVGELELFVEELAKWSPS